MWHQFAVSNQANEVVQNNRVCISRRLLFGAFLRKPQETFREIKTSAESRNKYRTGERCVSQNNDHLVGELQVNLGLVVKTLLQLSPGFSQSSV